MNKAALVLVLFVFSGVAAAAQSGSSSESTDLDLPASEFNMRGFPQWSKDLRRAEIVAFGSFPFTMFIVTTIMDTMRYSNHGWDQRYAPWPLKGSGAIDMSAEEHKMAMMYAAVGSLAFAFTDFIIVQIKRSSARKKAGYLPPGTPIIIHTPLSGDKAAETEDAPDGAPPDAASGSDEP
ncbi:MAG: hypothetical protein LBD71_00250 [Treponema sp.]|jgi:hypothetical protein|nr:hypothetical protein [Treponema sp.]